MPSIPDVVPMLATLAAEPFHRDGWVYEEKVDGWRMLAYKDGDSVRLVSRNGLDHTARFRGLTDEIASLGARTLILDGEVSRFDEQLVSRLHLLSDPREAVCTPPMFIAFDCLYLRGDDLRAQPLSKRRDALERVIDGGRLVLPVRRLPENGLEAWAEVERRGLEGLVAKDKASVYFDGRSWQWVKVKVRREAMFVIGGIVYGEGGYCGLLVGTRRDGRLCYLGTVEYSVRGVALVDLLKRAKPFVRDSSPFADLQRHGDVLWLEPVLVADITYQEIAQERLRAAVLLRLTSQRRR